MLINNLKKYFAGKSIKICGFVVASPSFNQKDPSSDPADSGIIGKCNRKMFDYITKNGITVFFYYFIQSLYAMFHVMFCRRVLYY